MSECPIVRTTLGEVKGRACKLAKDKNAKLVWNYSGIPFAKPPVDELRFEPPQKVDPWDGVYDATTDKSGPMQRKNLGKTLFENCLVHNEFDIDFSDLSEDCLYLNVYTSNPNPSANMPVLFWIYGGAFQCGGSSWGFNGQALCGLHDIVLVTVTYRVNAFGFLSCGKDSNWPGNMALLDQIMGLEWTRDNIKAFGGDPNNVTIAGESAGSISVSLHTICPKSQNLFHKAICHSGTANFPTLVKDNNADAMETFLKALEIEDRDPKVYMKKLKKTPAQKIVKVQDNMVKGMNVFSVCVDGHCFDVNPLESLRCGKVSKKPLLIGCNNSEGDGLLAMHSVPNYLQGLTKQECEMFMKGIIAMTVHEDKVAKAMEEVIEEYQTELKLEDDDKFKWSKIYGSFMRDTWFSMATIEKAKIYSAASGAPTYLYYMTQQLRYGHDKAYGPKAPLKPDWCKCDHADDIVFTFGFPLLDGNFQVSDVKFSEEEKEMSRKWMNYITTFMKTGNPNNEGENSWPRFTTKERMYLNMSKNPRKEKDLFEKRFQFFSRVLNMVVPSLVLKE